MNLRLPAHTGHGHTRQIAVSIMVGLVSYLVMSLPAFAAIARHRPFWEETPLNFGDILSTLSTFGTVALSYLSLMPSHPKTMIGIALLATAFIFVIWRHNRESSSGSATFGPGKVSLSGGIPYLVAVAGILLIVSDIWPVEAMITTR
jgi:hypothetical protein